MVIKKSDALSMGQIRECNNAYIKLKVANARTLPNLSKGRIWEHSNEIILPNIIFTEKEERIETETLLGEKITIHKEWEKYNPENWQREIIEKDYAFQVVGIYDIEEFSDENILYTSTMGLSDILIEDKSVGTQESSAIIVTVNSIANVENVKKALLAEDIIVKNRIQEELNPNVEAIRTTENFYTKSQIAPQYMQILIFALSLSTLIMTITSIVIQTTQNIKEVYKQENNIGVLKAVGYKNAYIRNIILTKSLYTTITALVLAITIFNFAFMLGKEWVNQFGNEELQGITQREIQEQVVRISNILIQVEARDYIFTIMGVLLITLLSTYCVISRIVKKDAAYLLKNKEEKT